MNYLFAFAASFAFVGLKSIQQLNVVRRAYPLIVPTSFLMAGCEVYVVATVAREGFGWLVFWVGLGGGLGSLIATWLHYKVVK